MIARTACHAMPIDVNRPARLGRVVSGFVFTIMLVAAGTPAAFAQAVAPVPIPPPPLSEDAVAVMANCFRLQQLLKEMPNMTPEERKKAADEVRQIVFGERARLRQQAIEDEDTSDDPLPPKKEDVDKRLGELIKTSCVYTILVAATGSQNHEMIRTLANNLLYKFDPPEWSQPAPSPEKIREQMHDEQEKIERGEQNGGRP